MKPYRAGSHLKNFLYVVFSVFAFLISQLVTLPSEAVEPGFGSIGVTWNITPVDFGVVYDRLELDLTLVVRHVSVVGSLVSADRRSVVPSSGSCVVSGDLVVAICYLRTDGLTMKLVLNPETLAGQYQFTQLDGVVVASGDLVRV